MNKKTKWILLLIVAMTMLLGVLGAQEVAETAEASGGTKNLAEFIFGTGMVKWFIDGGWAMWPILFIAIYGLAYVIWKFIALVYAIVPMLQAKKYDEVAELAAKTRGPVAAVVHAGVQKASSGIDAVEKAMENAAMIEMSYLEKGFVEMSTAITLAPMMGFLGTVAGMIEAFDAIAAARAVDATIVASGIKIALITTEAGLIVAIPVQFFYNVFTTIVDGLVIDMQRASEKVVETLIESR